MKLNSISAINYYVEDLNKTIKFYEDIGMRAGKRDDTTATFYVNWFAMTFKQGDKEIDNEFIKDATSENKGAGQYLQIKVDDVNAAYADAVQMGYKPTSEPRDWPWGNREFVLRDPDGYKLVFFQKLK
jgi:catechol 2,3-dioxygenase-like lactoylglutathione lyase family enzyme